MENSRYDKRRSPVDRRLEYVWDLERNSDLYGVYGNGPSPYEPRNYDSPATVHPIGKLAVDGAPPNSNPRQDS